MSCTRHPDGDPDRKAPWCMDCHPEQYARFLEAAPSEPPPPPPPVAPAPPAATPGRRRGYTAKEVADAIEPGADVWRRDTIRRRVQELENPYGLLEVVGERTRAGSGEDNQVYATTLKAHEALPVWDSGKRYLLHYHPLARPGDPGPSQKAARRMNPDTLFHRIIAFYIRHGS